MRRPSRGPNLKSLRKLGLSVSDPNNYEVTVDMHYERPSIDGICVLDQETAMSDRVRIDRLNVETSLARTFVWRSHKAAMLDSRKEPAIEA